ncbi:MAG: rod shape-determining protein MreC [Candidatus Omnitrophota bacterium]
MILVFILPVKGFIQGFFISFPRHLLLAPRQYTRRLEELEQRNLALSVELQKLKGLRNENARLRTALHFKAERKANLVGADIVAFDPSSWRRVVIVNAGKNSGIVEGLYVINEEGFLVGRITEVRDDFARLVLLHDSDFSLSVFVGENSFGLLRGGLEGLKVFYIEASESVGQGDTIWLTIPGFGIPLYIGDVKKVANSNDNLFLDVDVRAFAGTSPPRKIFIIR